MQTSHGGVLEDLGGLEQWEEVPTAKLVALNVGGQKHKENVDCK